MTDPEANAAAGIAWIKEHYGDPVQAYKAHMDPDWVTFESIRAESPWAAIKRWWRQRREGAG